LKTLVLNDGAQRGFVNSPVRAAAYIGGVGSGKTFAGIARGLKYSQQPMPDGAFAGPRGCIAAANYPMIDEMVMPVFFEIMDESGLWKVDQETSWEKSKRKAHLVANCKCADRHKCRHEAVIIFRSLDRPNWMRGLNLSWFYVDEGREISLKAWNVLWGRLRQMGYATGGWVCSTPNGYDWMWRVFHPESDKRLEGAAWFGASTMDNEQHLPKEYIPSLFAMYEGDFLLQEVYGQFVGVTEGRVFFAFDRKVAIIESKYDPSLELFSGWDFGIGDLNVVVFFQIEWVLKELPPAAGDMLKEWVPVVHVVGSMEASDRIAEVWAKTFYEYCDEHFAGVRPVRNIGDPAGRSRNQVTGTSVIQDLDAHGVTIIPAPKTSIDKSIRILNNLMAGNRFLVDKEHAMTVAAAVSSYHWKLDDAGNKAGDEPVHDWTSHYCDAIRYFALVELDLFPRREMKPPPAPFPIGTYGHLFRQVVATPENWLGHPTRKPLEWQPGLIRPRET
jgi:phage terminase large subunit